jgi:hypothetical protein
MSARAYDLEAAVAAHRASRRRGAWFRLADAEYDAIAGTVLRDQREALEEIVANLSVPSHPAAWVASALKVARERLAALPND